MSKVFNENTEPDESSELFSVIQTSSFVNRDGFLRPLNAHPHTVKYDEIRPIFHEIQLSDLALGTNSTGQLSGPVAASAEPTAFFRVRRVPLNQPLDTDGDGIDDVYELRHPGVLSPLRAADAAEDPDGEGFTNLEEYQCGTDPAVRNNRVINSTPPGKLFFRLKR